MKIHIYVYVFMKKGFIRFDFNFILALVALLASATSLYFQFREAGYEYEILNTSLSPLVRNRSDVGNINETLLLNQELDDLEQELRALSL